MLVTVKRRMPLRLALVTASVCGLASLSMQLVVGFVIAPADGVELFFLVAVVFTAALSALMMGGTRGLGVLWILLFALWSVMLVGVLWTAEWNPFMSVLEVPGRFVRWSMLGLPLWMGALYIAKGKANHVWRRELVWVFVWVTMWSCTVYLDRYATDVGGSPILSSPWQWFIATLVWPAPLFLSLWMARKLTQTR